MNREEAGATAASSLEGTNTGACSKSLLLQSAPKKWLWQVKWRFLARMACYHLYSASEQGSKKMKDNWLQTTSKIQRIFLLSLWKNLTFIIVGSFQKSSHSHWKEDLNLIWGSWGKYLMTWKTLCTDCTVWNFPRNIAILAPLFATKLTGHFPGFWV